MFTGELYPYQKEAFDLLVTRKRAMVCYEMGLGKTPITIAAIEHLMDTEQILEPGLVIALSSLKYQWADAITTFTQGTSKPLVVDGTPKQRAAQYETVLDWMNTGIDYVIMNYEQVVNDWETVRQLPTGFVVLDECTAIKSFRSKRAKTVKKLKSDVKFALTGTPMENGRPEEIFSQFQFIDPEVLGRHDIFDRTFIVRNPWGGIDRYRNLPVLHRTLSQAMVRKKQMDEDVAPYLPDVVYPAPLRITFDRASATLYRRIVSDLLVDLDNAQELFGGSFDLSSHYGVSDGGGEGDQIRGQIMSKIQCLRMLCDHPELLKISAQKFEDSFQTGVASGSVYAAQLKDEGLLDPLTRAPKMDAVVQYLKDFLDNDPSYKAVVFSTFVPTIDLLAQRLGTYGVSEYTGRLNAKQKDAAKKQFQTDPNTRLLLSSDAGGYGVDLPQANLLLNYDLPWQAGAAVQRNSRIIRASSQWKSVMVQDVLVRDSIEERQWDSLQQKSAIQAAVVDGSGINKRGGVDLTVGSLGEFLRTSLV